MEYLDVFTGVIQQFISLILNLDQTLISWSQALGPLLYGILFLIIFAETGFIVTPFLPGDSLLFAAGALCALDSGLRIELLYPLLLIAAISGDGTNYFIGSKVGPKVFLDKNSKFFKYEYLMKAQAFYKKYGARAIILGRFMPIVRTFVPFVAGIANMSFSTYVKSNVIGAFVWISSFLFAGFFFGNLPAVKTNFHVVIFAVIFISFLPLVIEFWKARKKA
jgi:membrane-associated protein